MEAIGHIIELLTHLTLGTSQSIMANSGRGISLIIGLSSSTLLFHHILLAIFLKMNLIPSHHMYLSEDPRFLDDFHEVSSDDQQHLEKIARKEHKKHHAHSLLTPWTFEWYLNIIITVFCMLFAGMVSGLCVGLAGIDHLQLEVAAKQDPAVAKSAKTIFRVIDQHHWMLVTLLLCNAAALEFLPLSMHKVVPHYLTIIVSIVGVVFISEVIPMSICTGAKQI